MSEIIEHSDAGGFVRRGITMFLSLVITSTVVSGGVIELGMTYFLSSDSADPLFSRKAMAIFSAGMLGPVLAVCVLMGFVWARIPLIAFLWTCLAIYIVSIRTAIVGAPISWIILGIEISATIISLWVAQGERLRRFLQEARSLYEMRWSPRYGYFFGLVNCAVWSSMACITLVEMVIADLIGFDLLATKGPFRLGLHIIALFLVLLTVSQLQNSFREPIKWLFVIELGTVGLVLGTNLIVTSSINPYSYPTLVFAIVGLLISRGSAISEYMEYMGNIRNAKPTNIKRIGNTRRS
jgi:hypothetical protein